MIPLHSMLSFCLMMSLNLRPTLSISTCLLGLPVFHLFLMSRSINRQHGYLTIGGTYAFEFFFDPITNFESKRLVKAIFYDGNWSQEFDPITNDFLFTDIDSIAFPYIEEIELYLSHQNLQPIGHIHEYQEEENYPEVPLFLNQLRKSNYQTVSNFFPSSKITNIYFFKLTNLTTII